MAIFNKRPFHSDEEDYGTRYYEDEETGTVVENDAPTGNIGFGGVNLGGGGIELKVVRPENFEDVPTIADHLLSGRTVVLNLETANKETARRIIDFLSGVAYSIDGQMKRVANNTYIITPNNVDVTDTALSSESGTDED